MRFNKFFIAHRGNINGRNIKRENSPDYIKETLDKGYDVEIDVWCIDNEWYFGHDKPQYKVDLKMFIYEKKYDNRIWFHCKNFESLYTMNYKHSLLFNQFEYFWHENDNFTLTSKRKYIWTYPNKKISKTSICVLPEISNYTEKDLNLCKGICSDYISKYEKMFKDKISYITLNRFFKLNKII